MTSHLIHLYCYLEMITTNSIVVDGGSQSNLTLQISPDYCNPCHPWTPLHISRVYLFVVDTKNINLGLTYAVDPGEVTPSTRTPCKAALEITRMKNFEDSRSFYKYLKAGYLTQKKHTKRSPRKLLFSDWNYCCIGPQPCRDQP